MRAALIGNIDDTDPGLVGHALRARGFSFTEFARESHEEWSDPAGFDLVVSLGSSWSAYWPQVAAETTAERAWIRTAHDRAIPVLGICFGGQQLAAALGGTVQRSQTHEIGWHAVSLVAEVTVPGAQTLAGQWFQWHYDSFSVPSGATAVADSPVSPQAFVSGRSLGLQFHPEVTAGIVAHWSRGEGAQELRRAGIDADELFRHSATMVTDAVPRTDALVEWFLSNVAQTHVSLS